MAIKVMIADKLSKVKQEILDEVRKVDKDNNASYLAEMFMWDEVMGYANKRYDVLMKEMIKEEIIKNAKEETEPGDYVLGESRHFVCTASVSAPARTFDPQALAQSLFKSKYKVPVPFALDLAEKAKVPKVIRRTVKFLER
jgi:hypothetical protein